MTGAVFSLRQQALRWGWNGLALLFIALAVVGAVRAYSPVPFWDMWGGYLLFFDQVSSGDWSVWWHQHNEHRIVLTRLFFWLDMRWFNGAGWFLLVVNYVLVALGAALFCRILREIEVPRERILDMHALKALVVLWMFFWCQSENLTWGFQSQFIMAQLLPLAALYMLYRSRQAGSATFALACLLGLLSVGTMANGILALPLMTIYAMLTRQGVRRFGLLAVLAGLELFAYFKGYSAPEGHGSFSQALREHPVEFVRYVLMYLGNPFNGALRAGEVGRLAAQLAGLFFVVSTLRFAWKVLPQPRQPALPLAMLFFIAYIGGTAFGTAGGRLTFGIDQALSSRYATPALMAWAALLVLYAPAVLALQAWRRRAVWCAFAALVLLMLWFQTKALHARTDEMFDRSVAALAIELRIKDPQAISRVYWDTTVIERTEQAADKHQSVFGLYPYRDARAQMGAMFATGTVPPCQGYLDIAVAIDGDKRFLRVDGWLFEPAGKTVPQVVRFLDADGKQVGYALGGSNRPDVAAAVGKAAQLAGYRGYLSSAKLGATLTVRGEGPAGPFCQVQVAAPQRPQFNVTPEVPSAQHATVDSGSVLKGNAWLGADFARSSLPGMRIYGSFIGSDADRGAIELRLKRGDRLYYRSGPTAGQQKIEINGGAPVQMPVATDWVLLEFSGEDLPPDAFTARLSDNGTAWGEWSAIAVISN